MVSLKQVVGLAMVVILWAGLSVQGREDQVARRDLKVEVSVQQEPWLLDLRRPGAIRPSYVAKILAPADRNLPSTSTRPTQSRPVRPSPRGLPAPVIVVQAAPYEDLSLRMGKVVSMKQRAFMSQGRFFEYRPVNNTIEILLYAVTEGDAEKMAKIFINYVDEQAEQQLQAEKDKLAKYQMDLLEAGVQIPQLEKEFDEVQESLKGRTWKYKTEADARERRIEYILMQDSVNIELAELKGKIRVLQRYVRENTEGTSLYEAAREQLMHCEVEQEGLHARKREIDTQYNHAVEFLLDNIKNNSINTELSKWRTIREEMPLEIQRLETRLEFPAVTMQPMKVLENQIVIYPVRER